MSTASDYVTPTGSIARKGVQGFVRKATPTRPNILRVRLSDEELETLQLISTHRNCTQAQLIRDMLEAISSRL